MLLTGCQNLHSNAHSSHAHTHKATPKPTKATIQDGAPPGPIPSFFKALIPKSGAIESLWQSRYL